MNLLTPAIWLWQRIPVTWRKSVLVVPGLYALVDRLHPERLDLFPLAKPLEGHQMRLHWQTCRGYIFGTRELEMVGAIERTVRQGYWALDVGANAGYFTLLLARQVGPLGKVVAFEPHPRVFEVLKENVTKNGYGNVIPECKAVADCSGFVNFSQDNPQPLSETESIVSGRGIEVPAVSLDDYVDSLSHRIDFVKIDVEGAETRVLNGMSRILERDHPVLVVELHGIGASGLSQHPALARLAEAGYSVSFLDDLGIRAHIVAEPKPGGGSCVATQASQSEFKLHEEV